MCMQRWYLKTSGFSVNNDWQFWFVPQTNLSYCFRRLGIKCISCLEHLFFGYHVLFVGLVMHSLYGKTLWTWSLTSLIYSQKKMHKSCHLGSTLQKAHLSLYLIYSKRVLLVLGWLKFMSVERIQPQSQLWYFFPPESLHLLTDIFGRFGTCIRMGKMIESV